VQEATAIIVSFWRVAKVEPVQFREGEERCATECCMTRGEVHWWVDRSKGGKTFWLTVWNIVLLSR
jgi:hypothetical protein